MTINTQTLFDIVSRRFGQSEKNPRFKGDFLNGLELVLGDQRFIGGRGVTAPTNLETDVDIDSGYLELVEYGILMKLESFGWVNRDDNANFSGNFRDQMKNANMQYYFDNDSEGKQGSDP